MIESLIGNISSQIESIKLITLVINGLIHILFAGAVAKDSGSINKLGLPTILVSGVTWAFATLLGGVFVAALYWLLHHAKLTSTTKI